MEIKYTVEEDCVRVMLKGDLDTPATIEVQPVMDKLLEYASKEIVMDCTHLDYIASSGLRLLIALYKKCIPQGGSVRLENVNPDVRLIFTETSFDKIFFR